MERVIHILTGCTAAGKTELALQWAEQTGAEIVSCDSLLFYRGMDIGTAKPTPTERARVPHHLIDVCDVTARMDVTYYVTNVRAAVEDIWRRGRRVLVTGGSGFYLQSFFAPVADDVDVPAALRAEIAAQLESEGREALVGELRRLNPEGLGGLDTMNPRRVVRALERCRASGRTLAELAAEFRAQAPPFGDCAVKLAELTREPADLNRRIETRVAAMLRAGLIDEVRGLLARGLKENPSAARAIGYRETIDFLEGRLPESGLAAKIAQNTRALVKKQRTWFRTQLPPHRLVPVAAATAEVLFV
jgi:tRNA dimethylallyltransferase